MNYYSVFCFTLQFKYLIRILQQYVVSDKETSLYFSTFVFPVYSYDSKTQDVIEQSTTVLELLYVFLIGNILFHYLHYFIYTYMYIFLIIIYLYYDTY